MAWPPKKNVGFTFEITIRDADGDFVTTGTLSSTVVQDGVGVVGPVPTVVTGGGGFLSVTFTNAQNNFNRISFTAVSDAAGAKPFAIGWDNVTRQIDDLSFPTVSGRSIDVLATGEIPIDIDTSIGTLSAAQIEASALNGKGDWNIGKAGYQLAATGLDLIGQAAVGMVEIAKAVWDRLLLGSTHNIQNSAGKRLRQLQEAFIVSDGIAQSGTVNTIKLAATESSSPDIYKGDRIVITAGTGAKEHGLVTGYNGTTKDATMSQNWIITPDSTSEYRILPADCDVETWQNVKVSNSPTTNLPEVDSKSINDSLGNAGAVTEARLSELDSATSGKMANEVGVVAGDWAAGGRLDLLLADLVAAIDAASGEPGQGIPPVIATMKTKIDHIYKGYINKKDSSATLLQIYNNAATVVDHKASQSETAGVVTAEKLISGP